VTANDKPEDRRGGGSIAQAVEQLASHISGCLGGRSAMTSTESLMDLWLDLPGENPERLGIEAQLRRHSCGSLLLDFTQRLHTAAPAAPNVADAVRSRLPAGSPATYRRLGELVVRAWQDPTLREALRRSPAATLRQEGIALPGSVDLRVVEPDQVHLPTAKAVELPLPPASSPPTSAARALQALGGTPWGALVGDLPLAVHTGSGQAAQGSTRSPWLAGDGRGRPRASRAWLLPSWATAALVLVAVVLVVSRSLPWAGAGVSGAALGGGNQGALVGVAAAAAVVAAAIVLATAIRRLR
jgi:hypothetical protein